MNQIMLNNAKEIDFYWFSGTGNTLVIAQTLRIFLEAEGYTVNLKAMEKTTPSDANSEKTIGLAFPVAGQGTYPLVWDFIRNLPSPSAGNIPDADAFMIDTMSAYSGGVKGPIKKILKKKGFRTIGAKEIVMPTNLMRKQELSGKDRIKIEKAANAAEQFGRDLISGQASWMDIPIYSDFMSSFSRMKKIWNSARNHFPMKVDDSSCTRCRLCETNCPTQSWHFDTEQNRMIWTKDECLYCLRCFSYCPVQAINYGKKKYIQNRGVSSRVIGKFLQK